jgi:hypothetical protein
MMKMVCLNCHEQQWVDNFYTQRDQSQFHACDFRWGGGLIGEIVGDMMAALVRFR